MGNTEQVDFDYFSAQPVYAGATATAGMQTTPANKPKIPSIFTANPDSSTEKTSPLSWSYGNVENYIYSKIPEEGYLLSSSPKSLKPESTAQTIKNLPRKADGSIDADKLKKALTIAVNFIKTSNQKALDKMHYGVYGNQANNVNVLAQFIGPEVAHLLEKAGLDTKKFDTDLGLQDTAFSFGISDMELKTSTEVEQNIKNQNTGLDALLKLDLNKPGNIEKLVVEYQKLTGTSFSPTRIFNAQNSNAPKNVQFEDTIACFGIQNNLIDAMKNEESTKAYVGAFRGTASFILSNQANPIVKAIGDILPFYMGFIELITKDVKDGDIVNLDNVTWDNMVDVVQNGAKQVVVNHVPFASKWFWRILQKMGLNISNAQVSALLKMAN